MTPQLPDKMPAFLRKLFHFLSSLGLILFSLIICLAFGAWIYRFFFWPKILTLNHPIRVEQSVYAPGDEIIYTMDYCKAPQYYGEYSEIHYSFIGGLIYPAPTLVTHSLPTGCHVVREVVMLPPVPDGEYVLEMIRVYQSLSVNQFIVQSESQKFTVRRPECLPGKIGDTYTCGAATGQSAPTPALVPAPAK